MTTGDTNTMNTQNERTTIHKIKSSIGIEISEDWLQSCRVHLGNDNEDAILHQILHSDLRTVVDRSSSNNVIMEEEDNNNVINDDSGLSNTTSSSNTSMILREAISKSLSSLLVPTSDNNDIQNNTNNAAIEVPNSFKCLVQIEELLDVSLNAETRLQHGPSSTHAVGNQRVRCLKMILSDGYTTNNNLLIGMEVAPIKDLSTISLSGIKVLLKAPLSIRLGMLLLHDGNTVVLGGCIPSMVGIQQKAILQAQKTSGVGIDPTIKALIWNPFRGDEEDADEAHIQSGDVVPTIGVVAPVLRPSSLPLPIAQVLPSPPTLIEQNVIIRPPTTHTSPAITIQSQLNPNPNVIIRPTTNTTRATNPYATTNTRSSSQSKTLTNTIFSTPNNTNPATTHTTTPIIHTNPLDTSTNMMEPIDLTNDMSNDSTSSILQLSKLQPQQPPPIYPPLRQVNNTLTSPTLNTNKNTHDPIITTEASPEVEIVEDIIMEDDHPFDDYNLITTIPTLSPVTSLHNHTNSQTNIHLSPPTPTTTTTTTTTTTDRIEPSPITITSKKQPNHSPPLPPRIPTHPSLMKISKLHTNTTPTPVLPPSNHTISFQELVKKLQASVLQDPTVYKTQEHQIFRSQCKISNTRTVNFNLEKIKKKNKGGGGSSYEYSFICQWGTNDINDGVITCKISNSLLEPFFGVTASKIRKIKRANKNQADKLTKEGGNQVIAAFTNLSYNNEKDLTTVPILLVVGKDG